jgi:DNA-binding SARP family transcriptional activator/Tfp pilus assembly protein PilF
VDGHIRLRVLGPVELHGRDGALRPGGPQLRLLLALLALSAGRVVPVAELIEALWEQRPPQSAQGNLQILIVRLRKPLAAIPDCRLDRYGDGYQLEISPLLVDAHVFRSLVRSARHTRDDAEAIRTLGKALELWRGPALADVAETATVAAIRVGLAEEYLSAVQDRFDRLLAAGRHDEAAEEIPSMLSRHPLTERLAGTLMIAWYRCGRQADALQVFRDLRRRLTDELGIEPGVELQRLHQQILSGDRALAAPQQLESRNGLRQAAPRQYLLERPLLNGKTRPAGAGLTTSHRAPRQLPAAPATFAGRQREMDALTAWLDGATGGAPVIATIGGTPGVGKTALAVHWAHQMRHRFPDGQLYMNLRGFDTSPAPVAADAAIGGLLESLGVSGSQISRRLDARIPQYRSLLADKRLLLVLDNARDEAQVRPLLPGSPACTVLVTSRNDLSGLVAAEGAHPVRLDLLTEAEARQLLADRLGADRVAADAAVTELTSLCAHLPLALALAAARAITRPALPLAALADELRGFRDRLDGLDVGDEATNIRAVFSWSYRLLSDPAARMFRLLGSHAGPDISVAAAASLAAVSLKSAQTELRELASAALVDEPAPGRFTLHDLLRAYAATLSEEKERRTAVKRALDYYLHTASAAVVLAYPGGHQITLGSPGPGKAPERFSGRSDALAWLQAEQRVLVAACATAADTGLEHAWQLPAVLSDYLARKGHYADWARSQQTALDAARHAGDDAAQALALRGLGEALAQIGSRQDARRHLQDALQLYGKLSDRAGQARCQASMGRLCEWQGEHIRSLHHARHALRLYREVGDVAGQAAVLNGVGWEYAFLGHDERALSHCNKALELHLETGNRFGQAITFDSLGYCHHQAGRHSRAVAFYQQALDAYADIDDPYYRAHTLIRLAETHLATGNPHAAYDTWQQAAQILDDLHHPDAKAVRALLHTRIAG